MLQDKNRQLASARLGQQIKWSKVSIKELDRIMTNIEDVSLNVGDRVEYNEAFARELGKLIVMNNQIMHYLALLESEKL